MHNLSPADEFAEIRAELARLKAREAALRAHFLRDPDHGSLGRWSRVEVVESHQSRFNAALLPSSVLNDPQFREDRVVLSVRVVPVPFTAALRPGWPIRRDANVLH